ncbi:acyltransferase [Trinickia sp. LjRoot230]|uniref:acyltransferase family protein n=1 Tax=Trinickia sp. LjRoot230 TaxID=3342288 RepID=UPI003ECE62B1
MRRLPRDTGRFDFVEGTRGVAAMMVFLTHYCSAFLPVLARVQGATQHFGWESILTRTPVFAAINGGVAVFIFYIMSGFVLAGSFINSDLGIVFKVMKRLIRLIVPVAASVVIASVLLSAMPVSHESAAKISSSSWLAILSASPLTIYSILKESLLDSMILGYSGASIFDHAFIGSYAVPLLPVPQAANIPLWSLHGEFWGSMLVIALSASYRKLPRKAFWCVYAIVFALSGTSQFSLFLVGFAAYIARNRVLTRIGIIWVIGGVLAMTSGIYLCYASGSSSFAAIAAFLRKGTWLSALNGGQLQGEIAAILLLFAIVTIPWVRSMLEKPFALLLGKISFSLYLIHFPILFTVGCSLFVALAARVSYGVAVLLTTVVTGALTFIVASLFEIFVDRRAVALSKQLANRGRMSARAGVA